MDPEIDRLWTALEFLGLQTAERYMGMLGRGDDQVMVVTVKTAALLEILQKNKTKHVQEFKDACVVHHARMIDKCKTLHSELAAFENKFRDTALAKQVQQPTLNFHDLPYPESHEGDYDDAIEMLKLHDGPTLVIDNSTYRQFVKDEWSWSSRAKQTNSAYLVGR